jgi:hypothetical protein
MIANGELLSGAATGIGVWGIFWNRTFTIFYGAPGSVPGILTERGMEARIVGAFGL